MKMIARIRNAMKWNRAIDYASAGDFSDALSALISMDTKNLGHLFIDYHVEKSYLLFKNKDENGAKKAIADALNLMGESNYLSEKEETYRRKYLEWLMAAFFGLSAELAVSYKDIELHKVSARTKSLFPLRHHPQWVE